MHLISKASVFIFPPEASFLFSKKRSGGNKILKHLHKHLFETLNTMQARTASVLASAVPSWSKTMPGCTVIRTYLSHELTTDRCPGKYGEGVEVTRWLGKQRAQHHCGMLGPAHGWVSVCAFWRLNLWKSKAAWKRRVWGHQGCQQSSQSLEGRLHLLNYRWPLATGPLPRCNYSPGVQCADRPTRNT